MDRTIPALPFVVCMFVGMLLFLEIGRRVGKRRLAKDPQGAMSGLGLMEGAVFSLFGLLIAFTFSGAPARLDARRQLIQQEANAIGTAYLRLDLLAPESQPALRQLFRRYVDSRLEIYAKFPDIQAARAALARSAELQTAIWKQAIAAARLPDSQPDALKLLIPSLNEMFDIASTRTTSASIHPPVIIFVLLFVLALVCFLLVGYGMATNAHRNWLHVIAFAAIVVLSVYVILEIEYPRMGLLPAESAYDQVLVELRHGMQ